MPYISVYLFLIITSFIALTPLSYGLSTQWSSQGINGTNADQIQILLQTAMNLIILQISETDIGGTLSADSSLLISVVSDSLRTQSPMFYKFLSSLPERLLFMNFILSPTREQDILKVLMTHKNQIAIIIVYIDDCHKIDHLIRSICSSPALKWTHLLHSSEWIFMYPSLDSCIVLTQKINRFYMCFNYFTSVVASDCGIRVSRKSRETASGLRIWECLYKPCSRDLLKSIFPDLGQPKRLSLEGMRLPVALLFDLGNQSEVESDNDLSVTRYDRLANDLMHLLAKTLKFEAYSIIPEDDGLYGHVLENGTVTGMAGLVARKEAAFASGFSREEKRFQVVDYSDIWVAYSRFNLIYKLPDTDNQLDSTLVNIVQPYFYLTLVGPVLIMAMLGTLTHVMTKSCSSVAADLPTVSAFRRLTSFQDYVCFQNNKVIASQTGRVLRASWAVFCFIIVTAYSAHLVMGFTVRPQELRIDSLQKLLDTPRYRFGVFGTNRVLLSALGSSTDPINRKFVQKVMEFNTEDPSTLSINLRLHASKVMSGNYAFLDYTTIQELQSNIEGNFSNVRSYPMETVTDLNTAFLIMPKDVFYKDILNEALISLEEAGHLGNLKQKHNVDQISTDVVHSTVPVAEEKAVSMSRILILVYIVGCGIGAAFLCLVGEYLFHRLWQRKTKKRLNA